MQEGEDLGDSGVGMCNFPLFGCDTLACSSHRTSLGSRWAHSPVGHGQYDGRVSWSSLSRRDGQERTPYCVSADKLTRNAFRKFMVDHPDKYDYSRAKVGACPLPSPSGGWGTPEQSAPCLLVPLPSAQWEMLTALCPRCQGP